MDLNYRLYLERAENELYLSEIIFEISKNEKIQKDIFNLPKSQTFYSSVISHSYYVIFYSAKSYLLKNGIKTKAPEEHKKTYEEFEKLVKRGIIDLELFNYYKELYIKAETLLEIFGNEKQKRGNFTYKTLPQANIEPSRQSLNNAKLFFKHIYNLLEN